MPKTWMIRVLTMSLLLTPAAAFAARSDWREMTVGHFHLFSTLRDSSTRDVARQLQAFEKTVGELLLSEDRLPDVPTLIYILDKGDFERYAAGRPGLGGIFFERPYANVIVINGAMPFDYVRVTVFHEYTHFIQRSSTTRKLPPWYIEGYAELFSSFKMDGQKIILGNAPVGVGIDLANWIPMERLLAVKHTDPEYRAERLMPQFYGESWALVHMLLFDDQTLLRPTSSYLTDLDTGIPEAEAFKSFPFDKAALDKALRNFIDKRVIHLKSATYKQEISVDDAPITRMTAAQADTALARLMFTLDRSKDLIEPVVAQARKESPEDPALKALSARIAAHQGEPFDVGGLAASLSKSGADDAQLRIDVADALLVNAKSDGAAAQAFAILNDLARSENPPVEAVMLWTGAAGATGMDAEQVLPVLERTAVRVPHNTRVLQALARGSEAAGKKGAARSYYNRIILVSEFPEERLWAQKQADSIRLQ
jgi:hypothetical protein